jgi:hypothetical protein
MASFANQLVAKSVKLAMFGKGYTQHEYEADAIREEAARRIADELPDDAVGRTFLHEAVVRDLQKELNDVKAKLIHHSTTRELILEARVLALEKERSRLQARVHWETTYGWTLPGAFLLATDGDGEHPDERESRLYGGDGRGSGDGSAGGARPGGT